MKFSLFNLLIILFVLTNTNHAAAQSDSCIHSSPAKDYQCYKVNSRIHGLKLALHSYRASHEHAKGTILLVHGSSFPSKLSFAFRMGGTSWVDHLTAEGFNVYALDFLGYGDSDRYPEMIQGNQNAQPLGRGAEVSVDLNLAVDFILARENIRQIDLLGHSWGGAVAATFAASHPDKVNRLVMYAGITAVKSSGAKTTTKLPAYSMMTSSDRVHALNSLAPESKRPLLANELFEHWGNEWLKSDPLNTDDSHVRYPAGYKADLRDMFAGYSVYDPARITSRVLIIRGEYDRFPSGDHAQQLLRELVNAKTKHYVEINEGTHVLHLEKNRHELYARVIDFLTENRNVM